MKRCPECNFIYEDEQCLCDMDGTALLPDCHILATDPSMLPPPPARPVWLQLTIAVTISVLAGLGYYALNNQPGSQESRPVLLTVVNAQDSATRSSSLPTAFPSSTMEDSASMKMSLDDSASLIRGDDVKSESLRYGSTDSGTTARISRAQLTTRRNASANNPAVKKESRIGTFLKRTGRFLKKPFKN